MKICTTSIVHDVAGNPVFVGPGQPMTLRIALHHAIMTATDSDKSSPQHEKNTLARLGHEANHDTVDWDIEARALLTARVNESGLSAGVASAVMRLLDPSE